MSKKINQYLITRFNIYAEKYFLGDLEKFFLWTNERVKIFKNITLPSVSAAHAYANFKWIILFDEKSPRAVFDLIEEMAVNQPFIVPCFVEHGAGFMAGAASGSLRCIQERLTSDVEYILTTRIDNDDAMHEKYMYFLHVQANKIISQAPIAINYERGVCHYDGVGHVFNMKVTNMFVSLLEPVLNFRTVIAYHHGKIGDSVPVFNVENGVPLWVMNVHGKNWMNTKKNGKIISDLKFFNFIIDQNEVAVKENSAAIVSHNF